MLRRWLFPFDSLNFPACALGQYSLGGFGGCVTSPAGNLDSFMPLPQLTSEMAGYFVGSESAALPEACTPDSYSVEGASNCAACSALTWAPGYANAGCEYQLHAAFFAMVT